MEVTNTCSGAEMKSTDIITLSMVILMMEKVNSLRAYTRSSTAL